MHSHPSVLTYLGRYLGRYLKYHMYTIFLFCFVGEATTSDTLAQYIQLAEYCSLAGRV